MIEIGNLLKRAWQILWNYKVLWFFGLILALTGAGGSSGGSGGSSNYRQSYSGNNNFNGFNGIDRFTPRGDLPAWMNDMGNWFNLKVLPLFATPEKALQTAIIIAAIFIGFCIVMGLLFALLRYPAETATMRMVDDYDATGNKLKFKQGWKLGWNVRAFRVWLVDLLLGLPGLLFVAILLGLGILFAVNASTMTDRVAPGLVVGIGLFIVFCLAFGLFMAALGLLRQFVSRAAAIDGMTVGAAFAEGWRMFKRYFKHAFLVWLVLLGIGIGFGFAAMIVFFILIPAYAVMSIPGAVLAAIPGAIGFGITSIFTNGWLPWLVAALVALPVFLTVVFSPLSFVSGLYVIFDSNVWTLTYRQFKLMDSIPAVPAAAVVPPAVNK
jgi:hypothetical protein